MSTSDPNSNTPAQNVANVLRRFGWTRQDYLVRSVSSHYAIVTSLREGQTERIAACLTSAGLLVGEPIGACISVQA